MRQLLAGVLFAACGVSNAFAQCGTLEMSIPAYACRLGVATAAVPSIAGASYKWSLQGATPSAGIGTNRITMSVTDAKEVRLGVTIAMSSCTTTASGVIAVREPLVVKQIVVPEVADAGVPLTIQWSYEGAAQPNAQILSGDAFAAPITLPGDARSYTFTPSISGTRTIEVRASYANAIRPPNTPAGKRRASSNTTVTATECAAGVSSARLEVRGCGFGARPIDAPESFSGNTSFMARVRVETGESVQWTLENARASALNAPEIEVTPTGDGDVQLSARISRSASCFVETKASVAKQNVDQPCTNPQAQIELIDETCKLATVKLSFIGVPPFRGTLSNGAPFESSLHSMTLTTDLPETASALKVATFRDAYCEGTSTGAAMLRPPANVNIITRNGTCTNSKVIAQFQGVPPFYGYWYAPGTVGQPYFETNEYEYELPVAEAGLHMLDIFRDSRCESFTVVNRSISIGHAPRLEVVSDTSCLFYPENDAWIGATVHNAQAPLVVEWTDGGSVTSHDGRPIRYVRPEKDTTYTIARATDGRGCLAELTSASTLVTVRPPPALDTFDYVVCAGKTGTATLRSEPPRHSTASLHWTFENGEIVTGQGTSSVTYRSTKGGNALLRVDVGYPDGACETYTHGLVYVMAEAALIEPKVEPATIKAGGTAIISFGWGTADAFGVVVAPERMADLGPLQCADGFCTATYKDSVGAGSVPIAFHYSNLCTTPYKELTLNLTITP